ncbi:unnamed protein product [Blepharisma stoltei]|uniref:Uncharacterized protein n=1 Tax=Blepharisma stoltei TaxID=1481888 RepID=A0AAU9K6E0_9CILI|nr:unnamed protein product [Blepharisma stoltei]
MDKDPKVLSKSLIEAISAGDSEASIEILEKLISIDAEIKFRISPKKPKQEIKIKDIKPQQKEVKYNAQQGETRLPPSHEPRKAVFTGAPRIINNKDVPLPEEAFNLSKSQIYPNPNAYGQAIPNIPYQEWPPMPPRPVQPKSNNNPPFIQENPAFISKANIPNPSQNKQISSQNELNNLPNLNPAPLHKAGFPNPPQNELNDLPNLAPAPILNPYELAHQAPLPDLNAKPYKMAPQVLDPIPDININPVVPQKINVQQNIEKDPIPNKIVIQEINAKKNIEENEDFRDVLDKEMQGPPNNENNLLPPENENRRVVDLTEEELEQRKQEQAQKKYEIAKQLMEVTGTDLNTAIKISERVSSLEAAFQLFYG